MREIVNRRNRLSTCPADIRFGWNDVLEEVLLQKGQYFGFRYLCRDEVPRGEASGRHDFTRRHYYGK